MSDPSLDSAIGEIGEFALLDRLRAVLNEDEIQRSQPVEVPSGDDAAVVRLSPGHSIVLTTDVQIAGRHFLPAWTPARALGHRAMTVNLSDLAAMGARPTFALVSAGLRADQTVREATEMQRGLLDALRGRESVVRSLLRSAAPVAHDALHRAVIVGGNLARVEQEWFLDVTVGGEVETGRAVRRSGAAVGDRIFVSGVPGRSAAGLALLRSMTTTANSVALPPLADVIARLELLAPSELEAALAYLAPTARLALGHRLAAEGRASAMIDLSDGLLSDLGHLCRAGGVGARLQASLLPSGQDPGLRALEPRLARTALSWSFGPSDDYELLFTLPRSAPIERADRLRRELAIDLTEIGEIVPGGGVEVVGAPPGGLPGGFDHFAYTSV